MFKHLVVLVALSTLIAIQIFASLGGALGSSVAAQSEEEVFVITGSTDIEDCQVEIEETENEVRGPRQPVSGPEPCQGGVVWAERTTLSQAEIRSENRSPLTRVVVLTGNAADDRAAVDAEVDALHRQFSGEDNASASPLLGTMGYLSPIVFPDAGSSPATASFQSCNEGTIGSIRTVTVLWRAIRPQARVRAEVAYKRINCQQWRIFRIRAVLLDQPRHGVYYRELRYEKIWSAAYSQYIKDEIRPGCNRLNTNWQTYTGLQTIIKAGFYAQHEVEDDEDSGPSHCFELGNSYTSARFLLTGGRT